MAAFDQSVFVQSTQNELEYRLVNIVTEAGTDDREAGVIRRVLFLLVAEEGAQRERIGLATGDGALAERGFKEPDHEHLEVDGGAVTLGRLRVSIQNWDWT